MAIQQRESPLRDPRADVWGLLTIKVEPTSSDRAQTVAMAPIGEKTFANTEGRSW
jgi:hypothetical protein